jgi:glycosyltransferase involved in cell wall biosynthesis
MRRLLLVTQRPLDYGGGASVRWQYFRDALPRHGWDVVEVSARPNPTANAVSTDPRAARLAAARATVMTAVGTASRPACRRLLGIQPEAFPPNALWSLSGRPAVRRAFDRARPDVVWATCPPPAALFAALAALDGGGVPFVAEMRDLWAGNPYFDAGGTLLTRIEKRAFARASAVVTVTVSCAQRMRGLHPEIASRLEVLPNGYDPALLELRDRPREPGERATLVHAGTLYGDRSAVTLLHALARTELASRTRLVLVGVLDPLTEGELRRGQGALEVVVVPPVSWRAAVDRVQAADIAVVINSPGTGGDMAAPSKLYEALALGTPVLALTNPRSESEQLLERLGHAAGCAPPGDEDAIARTVARMLDAPPPPVDPAALAPFSRAAVAERVAALLDRLST